MQILSSATGKLRVEANLANFRIFGVNSYNELLGHSPMSSVAFCPLDWTGWT